MPLTVAPLRRLVFAFKVVFRDNVDPEDIVSKHIKLLHRYNEAKDATQVLVSLSFPERRSDFFHPFFLLPDLDWQGTHVLPYALVCFSDCTLTAGVST
jgi:Swi5